VLYIIVTVTFIIIIAVSNNIIKRNGRNYLGDLDMDR
jgi:hypothetical protein